MSCFDIYTAPRAKYSIVNLVELVHYIFVAVQPLEHKIFK